MANECVLPCDFSTDKEQGFFWHRNHQAVGAVTLHHDGLLVFQGSKYRLWIENIGTPDECIKVLPLVDTN